MTEAQPPDEIKKLVLVIIGIAILGTIIALSIYFGVKPPEQQEPQAPQNLGACNCYTKFLDCCHSKNIMYIYEGSGAFSTEAIKSGCPAALQTCYDNC